MNFLARLREHAKSFQSSAPRPATVSFADLPTKLVLQSPLELISRQTGQSKRQVISTHTPQSSIASVSGATTSQQPSPEPNNDALSTTSPTLSRKPSTSNFFDSIPANEIKQIPPQSQLCLAVYTGNLDQVIEVLKSGEARVNAPMQGGVTPLIYAAERGHAHIVEFLIVQKKALPSYLQNSNALIYAVSQGHTAVVHLLLQHGCDPNCIYIPDSRTALFEAAVSGRPDMIELLLDYPSTAISKETGVSVDIPLILTNFDNDGNTLIHFAVSSSNFMVVRLVLERILGKLNLDTPTYVERKTPIMYAVQLRAYDIVALLLSLGANPHCLDKSHSSSFFMAETMKDAMLLTLFEYGTTAYSYYVNYLQQDDGVFGQHTSANTGKSADEISREDHNLRTSFSLARSTSSFRRKSISLFRSSSSMSKGGQVHKPNDTNSKTKANCGEDALEDTASVTFLPKNGGDSDHEHDIETISNSNSPSIMRAQTINNAHTNRPLTSNLDRPSLYKSKSTKDEHGNTDLYSDLDIDINSVNSNTHISTSNPHPSIILPTSPAHANQRALPTLLKIPTNETPPSIYPPSTPTAQDSQIEHSNSATTPTHLAAAHSNANRSQNPFRSTTNTASIRSPSTRAPQLNLKDLYINPSLNTTNNAATPTNGANAKFHSSNNPLFNSNPPNSFNSAHHSRNNSNTHLNTNAHPLSTSNSSSTLNHQNSLPAGQFNQYSLNPHHFPLLAASLQHAAPTTQPQQTAPAPTPGQYASTPRCALFDSNNEHYNANSSIIRVSDLGTQFNPSMHRLLSLGQQSTDYMRSNSSLSTSHEELSNSSSFFTSTSPSTNIRPVVPQNRAVPLPPPNNNNNNINNAHTTKSPSTTNNNPTNDDTNWNLPPATRPSRPSIAYHSNSAFFPPQMPITSPANNTSTPINTGAATNTDPSSNPTGTPKNASSQPNSSTTNHNQLSPNTTTAPPFVKLRPVVPIGPNKTSLEPTQTTTPSDTNPSTSAPITNPTTRSTSFVTDASLTVVTLPASRPPRPTICTPSSFSPYVPSDSQLQHTQPTRQPRPTTAGSVEERTNTLNSPPPSIQSISPPLPTRRPIREPSVGAALRGNSIKDVSFTPTHDLQNPPPNPTANSPAELPPPQVARPRRPTMAGPH